MKVQKSISNILILTCIISILISCTKDNPAFIETPENTDIITGRTIRYTVVVLSAEEMSYKTNAGIEKVSVTLVMNDSVYSDTTDINGYATFNNVAAGYVSVSIKSPEFTDAELLVDLTTNDSLYDATNIRNATTKIALLPILSKKKSKISGKAFADTDLTQSGFESAPAGINVTAIIPASSLINFVEHQGSGRIENMFYTETTYFATTNSQGEYSLRMPSIPNGLKVIVTADDFRADQILSNSEKIEKVYTAVYDTVTSFPGLNKILDINYK